ncbi:MFS transporter [Nonomuraea endophytica]|uniref:MFS transporter n=1 Tax=Nonomuraea endophytica TaxID=714136 RepID=UPI0037C8295C
MIETTQATGLLPDRRAPWMAAVPFLVTGMVLASYFVRIPSMKLQFGLSDGQLGLLFTLPILSALVAMQLTGRLVARHGSAPVVRVAMVALPLLLPCYALAGDLVWFGVVLVLFGAVDGVIDVSMNAHAITVECTLKRHVMNSCHAAWSIGAAIGSVLGGLSLKAGLTMGQHFALVAVAMVALAVPAGRGMLSGRADRTGARAPEERARGGWTARVLVFGLTGTVVLVVSGAVGNWSGIFLHEHLGATLAAASLGYVGFSVCEAGGRLVGDRLHERYGPARLVRWSGVIAVAGFALAVAAPVAWLSITGFALVGLGLSVLVPIIFSSIGHGADNPASALAKVNTLTYSGLLIGPVLVGWFADAAGLTTTLAGLVALTAVTLAIGLRRI